MRNFIQITITKKGENRARMVIRGSLREKSSRNRRNRKMAVLSMLSVKKANTSAQVFTMTIPRSGSASFPIMPMTALTRPFLSAAFGMPWTIARPLCPVRILPAAA